MVRSCCVPQCSKHAYEPGISFHRFPVDKKLQSRWVSKLRVGKPLTVHDMVCGRHFSSDAFKEINVTGKGCKRRFLKPNVVPSECLPKGSHDRVEKPRKPRKDVSLSSAAEASSTQLSSPKTQLSSPKGLQQACDSDDTPSHHEDFAVTLTCDKQEAANDYSDSEIQGADECLSNIQKKYPALMDACIQVDTLLEPKLGPRVRLADVRSDSELVALTGVCSLELMRNIVREFDAVRAKLSIRSFLLSSGDAAMMAMIKLYHDITISFLAFLFRIHRTTASENLKTSLCILSEVLKGAVYIPSDESIEGNLTVYFKKFPRTKLILDCTEVPIQRPLDLTSRILTYSHYKKTYTLKVLIGCAPSGMITFVSRAYGGRTSDSFITKECEILEKCSPYEQVMVDKGFLIDKLCDQAHVELVRPPFLRNKQQMAERDALRNQNIARARVHVERAIQRLKVFKILQHHFPKHLLPLFDSVMLLLAGLVNLSQPIFGEDKFL